MFYNMKKIHEVAPEYEDVWGNGGEVLRIATMAEYGNK
jgi:hypothetical protein